MAATQSVAYCVRLCPRGAKLDAGERRVVALVARTLLRAYADGASTQFSPFGLGLTDLAKSVRKVYGCDFARPLGKLLVRSGIFRVVSGKGCSSHKGAVFASMEGAAAAGRHWTYLPADLYSLQPDDAYQRLLRGPPPEEDRRAAHSGPPATAGAGPRADGDARGGPAQVTTASPHGAAHVQLLQGALEGASVTAAATGGGMCATGAVQGAAGAAVDAGDGRIRLCPHGKRLDMGERQVVATAAQVLLRACKGEPARPGGTRSVRLKQLCSAICAEDVALRCSRTRLRKLLKRSGIFTLQPNKSGTPGICAFASMERAAAAGGRWAYLPANLYSLHPDEAYQRLMGGPLEFDATATGPASTEVAPACSAPPAPTSGSAGAPRVRLCPQGKVLDAKGVQVVAAAARELLRTYKEAGGYKEDGPFGIEPGLLAVALQRSAALRHSRLCQVLKRSGIFRLVANQQRSSGKRIVFNSMADAAATGGPWAYLPADLYTLDPEDAHQRLMRGPQPEAAGAFKAAAYPAASAAADAEMCPAGHPAAKPALDKATALGQLSANGGADGRLPRGQGQGTAVGMAALADAAAGPNAPDTAQELVAPVAAAAPPPPASRVRLCPAGEELDAAERHTVALAAREALRAVLRSATALRVFGLTAIARAISAAGAQYRPPLRELLARSGIFQLRLNRDGQPNNLAAFVSMEGAEAAGRQWGYLPADLYSLDPDDAYQRLLRGPPLEGCEVEGSDAGPRGPATPLGAAATDANLEGRNLMYGMAPAFAILAAGEPGAKAAPDGLAAAGTGATGTGAPEAAGGASPAGGAADRANAPPPLELAQTAVVGAPTGAVPRAEALPEATVAVGAAAGLAAGAAVGAVAGFAAPPSGRDVTQLLAHAWRLDIGSDYRGRLGLPQPGQGPCAWPDGGSQGQPSAVPCGPALQPPGGAADAQLEEFLRVLPRSLRKDIRRCAAAALAGGAAHLCGPPPHPAAAPPARHVVDMSLDAGRPVLLGFSDGSKRQLPGTRVSIPEALAALRKYMQRLGRAADVGSHGAAGRGGGSAAAPREDPSEEGGRGEDADAGVRKRRGRDSERSGGAKRARVCERGDSPAPPPAAADGDLGLYFGSDNRCCPPGTLHRISALRHPADGSVYGLTYRVGRHLPGLAGALADVLADLAGRAVAVAAGAAGAGGGCVPRELGGSLLLLGRPGSGKTTLLRDVTRFMADGLGLSVVVVDTSNEIAGGHVLPHPCIGSARRMLVGERGSLARCMLEAVQNHGPQVVVVDEIANRTEVEAARTISARGVMLVATAHGTDLGSLLGNAELNSLVGGLQTVTLGDETARRENAGSKTRTERRGCPTFRTLVEVLGNGRLRLRPDVGASVDALLHNAPADQPPSALNGQPEERPGAHGRGRGNAGRGRGHRGHGHDQGFGGRGPSPSAAHPAEPIKQQPGSLILYRTASVLEQRGPGPRGSGGRWELLPPLEQLRWWRPLGDAAGGTIGQQLCVRLLRPLDNAPNEA